MKGIGRIGEAIITVKSTLILLIGEKLHRDRNGLQPSKLESCNFLPGNIPEYSTEKTGSQSQRILRKWIPSSFPNRDSYFYGRLFNLFYTFPIWIRYHGLNISSNIYFANSRITITTYRVYESLWKFMKEISKIRVKFMYWYT